jgi:hypothetical protein
VPAPPSAATAAVGSQGDLPVNTIDPVYAAATGLADLRLAQDGQVITLALVPASEPVPLSPTASDVNNPGDVG